MEKLYEEKLLNLLKTNQGHLLNQEISNIFGISSSQVDKLIQNLGNLDYEIEDKPLLGYRLISSPDKLYPQEISWRLENELIGKKILYFEEVASTMDIAHKLGWEGYPEGSCVFTDCQREGRGRMGRRWYSPKGKGIYFSLILRPSILPNEVCKLTILTSVCIGKAIHKVTGLTYSIKWPNDILINDKKVAGILTELQMEKKRVNPVRNLKHAQKMKVSDRVNFVVIGFGINTQINELFPNATSIKEQLGYEIKRQDLAREILKQLEFYYLMFKKGEFDTIINIWKNNSFTLGQRVKIVFKGNKNRNVEGVAVDLDKDGGLLIRDDAGFIKKIIAGEIEKIMREEG